MSDVASMPTIKETISARAREYLDLETTTVDISLCIAGSEARKVKPGGVAKLRTSFLDDGYQLVSKQWQLTHIVPYN